jgi:carbon storage regulator
MFVRDAKRFRTRPERNYRDCNGSGLEKKSAQLKEVFVRDVESGRRTVGPVGNLSLTGDPIQEGHLMLVLTRRAGESIVIGNGIKLTIVNIGPGRVKIGIDAPRSVRIDREEIHDRILNEKASDVLEAVSLCNTEHADQATMVSAGPDTGVISGSESPTAPAPAAPASAPRPTAAPENHLSRFRSNRKPR